MNTTDAAAQADTPRVLAREDRPFFNSAPDRTPAPTVYDRYGNPLAPGDRFTFQYGDDGFLLVGRLCVEEVYVIEFDVPHPATGAVSRMIRHRPQACLMEVSAEKLER